MYLMFVSITYVLPSLFGYRMSGYNHPILIHSHPSPGLDRHQAFQNFPTNLSYEVVKEKTQPEVTSSNIPCSIFDLW